MDTSQEVECSSCQATFLKVRVGRVCRKCLTEKQRVYRTSNSNKCTRKYEKTKKGFLVRLYRNMKSRIVGIQREKHHLYKGKHLLDKEVFYEWALSSVDFHVLFKLWEESAYERRLCPSVDRIDSSMGYSLGNMEWVTMSVNSSRGSKSRHSNK